MEKRKRKRFNRNAICSSYNYKESKKAHIDMLKEHHKSFSVGLLVCTDGNKDLSIKVQIALDNRKVKVRILGKIHTITMKEYKERFEPLGWEIVE